MTRQKRSTRYRRWQEPIPSHTQNHSHCKWYIGLDYYQRAFHLLHQEHARSGYDHEAPHPIRRRFWKLAEHREYSLDEARTLLYAYLKSVEDEIQRVIHRSSLAYWLHLYRRLSPGPIGTDTQPHTIWLTRAILEAAIQKHAPFGICSRIAESGTLPIEQVLGGLLMSPDFEPERDIVAEANQLVLTDFTHIDLRELYDLEKLAYEVWRIAATLRTIGKGAPFLVDDSVDYYYDQRSTELDTLLKSYDERNRRFDLNHSSSGVIFTDSKEVSAAGIVFLPSYNVNRITTEDLQGVFSEVFRLRIESNIAYNFVWIPFNLREFRNAHIPFASAFEEKYHVSLDAVLLIVAALCSRVFYSWVETHGLSINRYWQRSYEGPYDREFVSHEIHVFLPLAASILQIDESSISDLDIAAAIKFWELDHSNRTEIDLSYSGPHHIFLPFGTDRLFIDFPWVLRRLNDLFVGVWIADQNFKGEALERVIGKYNSVLPTKACESNDGQKRQIDYAVPLGTHLVIAECKAVGRSIGFDRGDPAAIQCRIDNVVERALSEIDDKAKWLASRPSGKNYDLSGYDYILPVAISPFVEFIPSLHHRYWISEDVPRVLTPKEFEYVLASESTVACAYNRIPI